MSKRDPNQRFLQAVGKLQPNAYGVTLQDALGLPFVFIYRLMDAAEAAGLITSTFGGPTPERGNRPKRFIFLTRDGLLELERFREPTALSELSTGWAREANKEPA